MFGFLWAVLAIAAPASPELQDTLRPLDGVIELLGNEPRLGKKNAKYTILQISDFACPHCARAFPAIVTFAQEHSDVAVVFSAYALTGDCNPHVARTGDRHRCEAAVAAHCAHQQQRYLPMATILYKTGGKVENQAWAISNSLPKPAEWRSCLTSPEAWLAVTDASSVGNKAQITGTPSFFVRGLVGKEWVAIPGGPDNVLRAIEAHQQGTTFSPPTTPPE